MIPLLRPMTVLLLLATTLSAQPWPDKNTATPDLVQTGFGPNGGLLPFDGSSYCGPTTAAMALGYLNAAGFTQLIGANPGEAEYLNLVRVLSGLGEASDSGGTLADSLLSGIGIYMDAKGIGAANRSIPTGNGGYHQSISQIQAANTNQQILFGVLGWYNEDNGVYVRNGGHFIAITDQAAGSPGSLTIHNPFPNALLNVPNTAANVQQTIAMANFVATSGNTSSDLPNGTYLQFNPGQQGVGPTAGTQAILEQVFALNIDSSQLPSAGFTPQAWVISSQKTLNTGGGIFDVTTHVTGAGGFQKTNAGDLVFHREATLTGAHTVSGGNIISRLQNGDAFGNGSVTLEGTGGMVFEPNDAVPAAAAITVASRADTVSEAGAQFTFTGGNTIRLDRGANPSLTVTLGGNSGNGVANFLQGGMAPTLVIEANDLGGTEKLLVAGSGANLPAVVNGTVGGNIVGRSGANLTGTFLAYDATNGFQAATLSQGPISASTATTLYQATTNQTLAADASAYALVVENTTIDGDFTLTVGSGSGPAGVILNGGTVATGELSFGGSQGSVYTSAQGGTIHADVTGTGAFVKFGTGVLQVGGSGSVGTTFVQSGTLAVGSTWNTSTTEVLADATLLVSGGGSVGGTTTATTDATISLNGGSLANVVLQSSSNASGPIQGATLQGSGLVTGNLDYDGYIAADPTTQAGWLTINGLVTVRDGAAWIFSLDTLVDNSTGIAGTDWNAINLTNPDATFGEWNGNTVSLLFDFGTGLDPNSGNAFWTQDRSWTILTFSGRSSAFQAANLSFPSEAFPSGNFGFVHDGNTTLLTFTAIPEPSAVALLALAGLGFLASRLRRFGTASDRGSGSEAQWP